MGQQTACTLPEDEKVHVHFDEDEFAKVKFEQASAYSHVDRNNLYCLDLESPVDSVLVVTTNERTQRAAVAHATWSLRTCSFQRIIPTGRLSAASSRSESRKKIQL